MAKIVDSERLLTAFVASEERQWIQEPSYPPLERVGLFSHEAVIDGLDVKFRILIFKSPFGNEPNLYTVRLSFGSGRNPEFPLWNIEHTLELEKASDSDCVIWPESEDEVINKVAAIYAQAPLATRGSTSIN